MEEYSDIIGPALIGLVVWALILYALISGAVKSGTKDMSYNIKITHRLLIKKLHKEGFTKKELMDVHNQTTDEFWASIPEDSTEEIKAVL